MQHEYRKGIMFHKPLFLSTTKTHRKTWSFNVINNDDETTKKWDKQHMTKGERKGRRKLCGVPVATNNTQATKDRKNYNFHHHNVLL